MFWASVHYACDAALVLAADLFEDCSDGFWVADYVDPTAIIHWRVKEVQVWVFGCELLACCGHGGLIIEVDADLLVHCLHPFASFRSRDFNSLRAESTA